MKNFKYIFVCVGALFFCLIVFVYTWDIPAPTQMITKNIKINNDILK